MTLWAESLYKSGYADGKKEAEGLGETELKEVLLSVKGIGEAKATAIIEAVSKAANEKQKADRRRTADD